MNNQKRIALLSQELGDVELDRGVEEDTEIHEEIQRVMQASAALESVYELLDKGDQVDVNPSQTEMSLAAIAVDQAGSLMEVPVGEITTAMESYDGSRAEAQLVMESLSEKVKQIWQALLAMAKRLWQWLKDTYAQLMDNSDAIDKRANALIEAVKDKRVTASGSEIVDDANLVSRLSAPGIDGKNIHQEYEKYVYSITDVILKDNTPHSAAMQKMDAAISKTIRSRGVDFMSEMNVKVNKGVVLDAANSIAKNVFKGKEGGAISVGDLPKVAGTQTYGSPTFLGNIGYYIQVPDSDVNLNLLKFGSYKAKDPGEIELRKLNDVQIKICVASWKVFFTNKSAYKDIQEYAKNGVENIEALDTHLDSFNTYSTRPRTIYCREALLVMRGYFTLSTFSSLFSMSHLLRVSRDVFRLCEMSVEAKAAA